MYTHFESFSSLNLVYHFSVWYTMEFNRKELKKSKIGMKMDALWQLNCNDVNCLGDRIKAPQQKSNTIKEKAV